MTSETKLEEERTLLFVGVEFEEKNLESSEQQMMIHPLLSIAEKNLVKETGFSRKRVPTVRTAIKRQMMSPFLSVSLRHTK